MTTSVLKWRARRFSRYHHLSNPERPIPDGVNVEKLPWSVLLTQVCVSGTVVFFDVLATWDKSNVFDVV